MQRNNLTVKAKLPRQQLAYLVLSKLLYIRPELATILRKTVRQHIDWRCWALRQKALSQALTERCFFLLYLLWQVTRHPSLPTEVSALNDLFLQSDKQTNAVPENS